MQRPAARPLLSSVVPARGRGVSLAWVLSGALAVIACGDLAEFGNEDTGRAAGDGATPPSLEGDASAAKDGSTPVGDSATSSSETSIPPPPPAVCGHAGETCCGDLLCGDGLACSSGKCASALTPATCAPGAPPWAFVGETPAPTAMTPYQRFTMFVTFRNCSGATVSRGAAGGAGLKLGFNVPRDTDPFGQSRITLPADVPNQTDVTIPAVLRAPPLTGSYFLGFGLLDEGVAWLPAESTPHLVTVAPPSKIESICNGVLTDTGGGANATAALQKCVDETPVGGTLDLPGGIYRVEGQLTIAKAITIRTAGTTAQSPNCWALDSAPCAVFRASENLDAPRGFFYVSAPAGVHLDRVVLDGNRSERLGSTAAGTCAAGTNGAGFNAHSDNCAGCSMKRSMSARALCGTGWEWTGDGAVIEDNVFRSNGDHEKKMMWSDGLTLLGSNGAAVRRNRFIDNSDIDFISGGAENAIFEDNSVEHVQQATFAGLMLDNFNGGTTGSFVGLTVKGNTINCGALLCDFGIELGPHPWYLSANIAGGTITGNAVFGAKIQINAEGAGTVANPLVVAGNLLGPAPASAQFGCGQSRFGAVFNVSPDSHVLTADVTAQKSFHICP